MNNEVDQPEPDMYEDLDPCPKHHHLYEAIARKLARHLYALDEVFNEVGRQMGYDHVDEIVKSLRSDNVRFNEVHFRSVLAEEAKKLIREMRTGKSTGKSTEK